MTKPDSRSRTNSGQLAAASGQVEDSPSLPAKAELKKDLELIVRAGKNLNLTHCRKLVGMLKLTQSLAVAIEARQIDKPEVTPTTIKDIIRSALGPLHSEGAWGIRSYYFKQCAEFFYFLFGLDKRTGEMEVDERWEAAIAYYDKEMNKRGRSTIRESFRKRIYEPKLLPILIDELLKAESRLRGDLTAYLPAINATTARLLDYWRSCYWVAFRVRWHIQCANNGIALYRLWYLDQASQACSEDTARIELCKSLYHLTVLVRFARDPLTSSTDIDTLNETLSYIDDHLSFGKADQAWLDDAVDVCHGTFNNPTGEDTEAEHPDEFVESVLNDPRGQLIFVKYKSIIEACRCRHEVDGIRFAVHGEDEDCSVLQLYKRWDVFEAELNERWLLRAQVAGMRSEGGIPSRQILTNLLNSSD